MRITTQRAFALGLLTCSGLLAILGASPGATLTFLLAAAMAAVVDVLIHRWGTLPEEASGPPADLDELDLASDLPAGYAQGRPVESIERDASGHPASGPTSIDLAQMSDQALCQAWRISYIRIRRLQQLPHAGAALGRASIERGGYLDEIERRYPVGFNAWMAAGARAASDPARFLDTGARSTSRATDPLAEPRAQMPTTPEEPDQDVAS